MVLVKVYLCALYFFPWNVPPWPLGSGRDMLYIGPNSKKKKVLLLIYFTTVKQSINNAYSCFEKKDKQGYTQLLNNIGFTIKGGHAICWPQYKE